MDRYIAAWGLRATAAGVLVASSVTYTPARPEDHPASWLWLAGVAGLFGVMGLAWAWWVVRPEARRSTSDAPWWKDLNEERKRRYADHRGLFLVHRWTPSQAPGQVADVKIFLWQHGPGPLIEGTIDSVEYVFGTRFEEPVRVIGDSSDKFGCEESMYGSMLCVARVHFSDGKPPLTLERYIDFDDSRTTKPSARIADPSRRGTNP